MLNVEIVLKETLYLVSYTILVNGVMLLCQLQTGMVKTLNNAVNNSADEIIQY